MLHLKKFFKHTHCMEQQSKIFIHYCFVFSIPACNLLDIFYLLTKSFNKKNKPIIIFTPEQSLGELK